MKRYINIFLSVTVLFSILLISSCTNDFEEINTNNNDVETVPTAYLLTQSQRALQGVFNIDGMVYSQLWAQTQYTGTSIYDTEISSFNSYYTGPLADLQKIIDLNSGEDRLNYISSGNNQNQLAIAQILKSYLFSQVTDIWGDIPYSEALKGNKNFTPKFDKQSDIYVDLINKLSSSIKLLKEDSEFPIQGDVIYDGNINNWKRFAASIMLKLGVRVSNVDDSLAKRTISEAISYGVFTSNADNALFTYLADQNNQNPIYTDFQTRFDYCMSDVLANKLKPGGVATMTDPRLSVYADPAPEFDTKYVDNGVVYIEYEGKTYGGMPYGLSQAKSGAIPTGAISLPGTLTRSQETKGIMMAYHDVMFLMAMATQKGLTTGDTKDFYEKGIRANMEYWGVDEAKISSYLSDSKVVYDGAKGLEMIMTQKWLASYTQGLTSWSDWRQTGYPMLTDAPDAVEGRKIPRRRAYPLSSYSLNKENVEAAVASQGEDNTATRVWWNK